MLVTESANDQAGEEEMADSSTVSTIVGSINEESGFVNVMKILEEERYGMERRLDLVTKVCVCLLICSGLVGSRAANKC